MLLVLFGLRRGIAATEDGDLAHMGASMERGRKPGEEGLGEPVVDHLQPRLATSVSRIGAQVRATGLTEKSCVPCRGGVPPLAKDKAQQFLTQTPGWELREGKRIERTFKFKNFREAIGFVDRVGGLAEEEAITDITFGWGYATISLHTHKIKGLHQNDFIMAAKINALAGASSSCACSRDAARLSAIGPRPDLPPKAPPPLPPEILPDTPPEAPPEPPVKKPPGRPPGV